MKKNEISLKELFEIAHLSQQERWLLPMRKAIEMITEGKAVRVFYASNSPEVLVEEVK